ncbi:BnaA06g40750D [Brassica napus]|uniref:BnaA06g40750D protein n=1 Tax=Brassica napus TaxID=3708 RepID=A0A078IXT2_BRANA|nr:BnaA06g40750D [Brassica napus]
MDSFTTQKTKPRKTKRLAKKSRVQIILDIVSRTIETIVVLVTVSKLCYQLVVTFHDSGVAAVILANRNLAFVVGNAIVITLLANSGLLLNQKAVPKYKSNDLYVEFVQESSRRDGVPRHEMRNRGKQSEAEKEAKESITETRPKQTENIPKQGISDQGEGQVVIKKKTKKIISEKRVKMSKPEKLTEQSTSVKKMEKESIVEPQEERQQIQSYQRSKSENLEGLKKSYCGRLKRSETDASSERIDSDDELRFKIESFIAKQRRNQNDD